MATTAPAAGGLEASKASWFGIGLALLVALGLVGLGVYASMRGWPPPEPPHLVSMADSAQAMQRAGETMQRHGQAMLDDGRRAGDQSLIDLGERWRRDGQAMLQGGRWMAMNPTAPGSLVTTPAELAAQGSWGDLNRTAQAMLHNPRGAREVDLKALRWNGLAMRAEGQIMAEHGRVMADQAELMVARHGPTAGAADPLEGARILQVVGGHLEQNGQAMIDYVGQLRRVMALP